eukprot:m.552314 g.552314  ORF g.552314 m.552314 type:complete len:137 (-) comp57740_c1_seq11:641-1051(-)
MRCLLSGCLRPDCGLFFAFEVLLVGVVFLFLEAFRIKKSSTQIFTTLDVVLLNSNRHVDHTSPTTRITELKAQLQPVLRVEPDRMRLCYGPHEMTPFHALFLEKILSFARIFCLEVRPQLALRLSIQQTGLCSSWC